MKTVRVILSAEAEEVYKYLNKESAESKTERMILSALNKKVELIKDNPHYGDPIAKKLIPREYREKFGGDQPFSRGASRFLEDALYPDERREGSGDNRFRPRCHRP